MRLTPDDDRPAPGAASARDWQLWLEDARRAAASGLWREAIHFVYWAAISRLESRRLWPADRARTPREYLALIAPEDPRKPGLSQLTSTFERFWYGGRAAAESDYRNAENLASSLIVRRSIGERRQSVSRSRRRCAMRFMSSLDPRDRRLLLWSVSIAIGLAVLIGFVIPNDNNNDNPLPSTYLSGPAWRASRLRVALAGGL